MIGRDAKFVHLLIKQSPEIVNWHIADFIKLIFKPINECYSRCVICGRLVSRSSDLIDHATNEQIEIEKTLFYREKRKTG